MNWPELDKSLVVDWLKRLVRIPSISDAAGGQEGPIQQLVMQGLAAAGAQVRSVGVDEVQGFFNHPLCHGPGRNYTNRPTVIAEMGPPDGEALLVVAHSDTVPLFAPAEWTLDPFAAIERDGAIYGLGASDDKWGLASILAMAGALRGVKLPRKLIFASTIDEENGVCNGMLLLMLAGVKAQSALYLDGQLMQICRGNLGGSNLYLHPSEDLSETQRQADIEALKKASAEWSRQRSALFDRDGFADNVIREISVQVMVREDDQGAIRLPFYMLPGETRPEMENLLDQIVCSALGQRAQLYRQSYREPWFEASLQPADLPLVKYMESAIRSELKQEPVVTTVSKYDGFLLTNYANIPTISFGPTMRAAGRGAYHSPDERLTIEELLGGAKVAYRAVQSWLEGS